MNLFAGITTKFHAQGWKSIMLGSIVDFVFRVEFWKNKAFAVFQNSFDRQVFINKGLLKEENTGIICGSGVDISQFKVTQEPEGVPMIALASRMLWDKGVGEFVEAAKILKEEQISCRMVLIGDPDPENPVSIPEKNINDWQSNGLIEWWGHSKDIPSVFAKANIVCLPSYHEGCPKVLIEAAASGHAIVTTDIPGCKEIVCHNENGLLVPVKDSVALADAIKFLIQSPDIRTQMGKRGREIALEKFSEKKIIQKTLNLYKTLLKNNKVQ